MDVYTISCLVLTIICATIEYYNRRPKDDKTTTTTRTSPGFKGFRDNYVGVYCLMMAGFSFLFILSLFSFLSLILASLLSFLLSPSPLRIGDWLQGPYVYSLYESYGFGVSQIGVLFIAGFGSSLVFGTIVGSLADRFGRKKACLLYCLLYALSCVAKHWNDFEVLIVGRVLGGIATSLLFSAFESWIVAEHHGRGFDGDLLGDIFSRSVFFGNGLVAIIAGVVGNYLVRDLEYGPLAPFDAAIVVLVVGGLVILFTWTENYGTTTTAAPILTMSNNSTRSSNSTGGGGEGWLSSVWNQFVKAFEVIQTDRRVFYLGCIQGLFEAAMYSFVFLWTPTMGKFTSGVPHGFVFANFMLACMVGSATAGCLMGRGKQPESYMRVVFAVGAVFLFLPGAMFYVDWSHSAASLVCYVSFCVFEVVVGIFWPSMMKMRSEYVPEEVRSTVINIFRMPLNLFVCVMLQNVNEKNLGTMFFLCSFFLLLVCGCQIFYKSQQE